MACKKKEFRRWHSWKFIFFNGLCVITNFFNGTRIKASKNYGWPKGYKYTVENPNSHYILIRSLTCSPHSRRPFTVPLEKQHSATGCGHQHLWLDSPMHTCGRTTRSSVEPSCGRSHGGLQCPRLARRQRHGAAQAMLQVRGVGAMQGSRPVARPLWRGSRRSCWRSQRQEAILWRTPRDPAASARSVEKGAGSGLQGQMRRRRDNTGSPVRSFSCVE